MYLGGSRVSQVVEGKFPICPFVCSNIRFAHYVTAARHTMPAACPPLTTYIRAGGLVRARSCQHWPRWQAGHELGLPALAWHT